MPTDYRLYRNKCFQKNGMRTDVRSVARERKKERERVSEGRRESGWEEG